MNGGRGTAHRNEEDDLSLSVPWGHDDGA
jgi:hypothetical protein